MQPVFVLSADNSPDPGQTFGVWPEYGLAESQFRELVAGRGTGDVWYDDLTLAQWLGDRSATVLTHSAGWERPARHYRLAARSDNLNAFGLRSYVCVALNGWAVRFAVADDWRGQRVVRTQNVFVQDNPDGPGPDLRALAEGYAVELAERLPDCPADVVAEVWARREDIGPTGK